MDKETRNKLIHKIIYECSTGCNNFPYELELDTHIKDDLGADSFVVIEIVIKLEESFGISIGINEFRKECRTVSDVISFVDKKITEEQLEDHEKKEQKNLTRNDDLDQEKKSSSI